MIGGALAGSRRTGSSIGLRSPAARDNSINVYRGVLPSGVRTIPAFTFPTRKLFISFESTPPIAKRAREVNVS
jgi:hypothetical protein